MGIIIAGIDQVEEYFESECVNQSSLKNLENGFGGYMAALAKKRKDKEENKPTPEYFLIGGAVDLILTGDPGEFEEEYYVSTLEKKPSEVEINIINSVFHELNDNNLLHEVEWDACDNAILAAADEFEWQMRWKAETRITKLKLAGEAYFEDLKNSVGMKILTSAQKNTIDSIVMSLTSNPKTKKYFDRTMQAEQKNMDFYYQLPIYFMYEGVECKALLDLVVVHKDNDGKIIKIEPIDLKTMSGDTLQFVSKMRHHRYDIQAAWYTQALLTHFNVLADKIEPFKFIVESTTMVGKPLVFVITAATLHHGKFGTPGGVFNSEGGERKLYYPQVKGYKQLMDDYLYYEEQGWKQDAIVDANPDIITMDYSRGITL